MSAPFPRPVVVRTRETISDRITQLQDQTQALAAEHVGELVETLRQAERLAGEIAAMPGAYPPGVVEVARRLGDDLAARAMTIQAVMGRRG